MKPTTVIFALSLIVEPLCFARRLFQLPVDDERLDKLKLRDQLPLVNPAMAEDQAPLSHSQSTDSVLLSDMIGIDRRINIFSSLVRDIESVSLRLDNGKVNTTVLAPLNSAIEALPRKPWEDPEDYGKLGDKAYEGDDGQERANRNLKRFVEAHIVTENPWNEGTKIKTLGGDEVWWEEQSGERRIMPGNIKVQAVGRAVGNGEVWVITEARNYAS